MISELFYGLFDPVWVSIFTNAVKPVEFQRLGLLLVERPPHELRRH